MIDRKHPFHDLPVVRTAGGHHLGLEPTDAIEILPPPPRELEHNALYLHPNGVAYQYDKKRDRFYAPGIKAPVEITATRSKLVKLIPEEQT